MPGLHERDSLSRAVDDDIQITFNAAAFRTRSPSQRYNEKLVMHARRKFHPAANHKWLVLWHYSPSAGRIFHIKLKVLIVVNVVRLFCVSINGIYTLPLASAQVINRSAHMAT